MKPKSLGQFVYEAYAYDFDLIETPWMSLDLSSRKWWEKYAETIASEVRRRDKVRRKR